MSTDREESRREFLQILTEPNDCTPVGNTRNLVTTMKLRSMNDAKRCKCNLFRGHRSRLKIQQRKSFQFGVVTLRDSESLEVAGAIMNFYSRSVVVLERARF